MQISSNQISSDNGPANQDKTGTPSSTSHEKSDSPTPPPHHLTLGGLTPYGEANNRAFTNEHTLPLPELGQRQGVPSWLQENNERWGNLLPVDWQAPTGMPTPSQKPLQKQPQQPARMDHLGRPVPGDVGLEPLNKRQLFNSGTYQTLAMVGAMTDAPGGIGAGRAMQWPGVQPQGLPAREWLTVSLPANFRRCRNREDVSGRIIGLITTIKPGQNSDAVHHGLRLDRFLRNDHDAANLIYDVDGSDVDISEQLATRLGDGCEPALVRLGLTSQKLRLVLQKDPVITAIGRGRVRDAAEPASPGPPATLQHVLAELDAETRQDLRPIRRVLEDLDLAINLFMYPDGRPVATAGEGAARVGWASYPTALAGRGIDWETLRLILSREPGMEYLLDRPA